MARRRRHSNRLAGLSPGRKILTIGLVGIGAFILWRLFRSGESETYGREAVGSGPCGDIDNQLSTPVGCGTATVTGYVNGVGSPIRISEIPGEPGFYLQSSPKNVWAAFLRMRTAAARNGVTLGVNSAFRTMAKQKELRRAYELGRGALAARPGYSTHQNGAAVDIAVKANSNILPWLRSNAGAYGFAETVPSEDWHWEYDPGRDRYAGVA